MGGLVSARITPIIKFCHPSFAPIYLGQGTGLLAQMKLQIQIMQVEKHVGGNFPNGVLSHSGKHSIAKLVETGCTSPGYAI